MTSALLFQMQSTFIYALMLVGLLKRKKRQQHVPIMAAVLVLDVALILQIELSRAAIAKAAQVAENPVLLNTHVALAALTVIFYVLLIGSGRRLLRGDGAIRRRHRLLGWSAVSLRTLTLATSFFVGQN